MGRDVNRIVLDEQFKELKKIYSSLEHDEDNEDEEGSLRSEFVNMVEYFVDEMKWAFGYKKDVEAKQQIATYKLDDYLEIDNDGYVNAVKAIQVAVDKEMLEMLDMLDIVVKWERSGLLKYLTNEDKISLSNALESLTVMILNEEDSKEEQTKSNIDFTVPLLRKVFNRNRNIVNHVDEFYSRFKETVEKIDSYTQFLVRETILSSEEIDLIFADFLDEMSKK